MSRGAPGRVRGRSPAARATGVAALALALGLAGCARRRHDGRDDGARADEAAEPSDLAGLGAALARDRATIARAIAGADADGRADAARAVLANWRVPADAWPHLVTAPFRDHHAAYAAAFAAATDGVADELIAWARAAAPIEVRWQYADDPTLAPDQARLRVALPVGRPGAIAVVAGRPLTPVFAHDGRRWRALIGLDRIVVDRLAALAPGCALPYRAAAREPCLAMSAPTITAALAGDRAALDRACARLRVNGCGVTP